MKKSVLAVSVAAIGLLAGCSLWAPKDGAAGGQAVELGRQVLPANDGWASTGTGTTGGAKATAENVFTVSSRKDLVAALKKAGSAPKILYVKGTINLSSDDAGKELFEKDYADPAYNFDAYKKAYDPTQWDRQPLVKGKPPKLTGPLEEARERSAANQKKVMVIDIPSNTTIVGVGKDAKMIKGNLVLPKGSDNIIIRNIAFEDSFDYFPEWDPGDSYSTKRTAPVIESDGVNYTIPGCQEKFEGEEKGPHRCNGGRWNSEYDSISVKGATHVWIDHCSFSDGERLDKMFPPVYGAPFNQPSQKVQHHDGAVDVTDGSDFVTMSYNVFYNHDKTNLIGGSDGMTSDTGKLNVTMHHNLFHDIKQRQPRVRYGKVHVYNNLYEGDRNAKYYPFAESIGLGKSAMVLSQNNAYELKGEVVNAELIRLFTPGAALQETGSLVNGKIVNITEAVNAVGKQKILTDIGWAPAVAPKLTPSEQVAAEVKAKAGPGKL